LPMFNLSFLLFGEWRSHSSPQFPNPAFRY
jgi:hypothetical protein